MKPDWNLCFDENYLTLKEKDIAFRIEKQDLDMFHEKNKRYLRISLHYQLKKDKFDISNYEGYIYVDTKAGINYEWNVLCKHFFEKKYGIINEGVILLLLAAEVYYTRQHPAVYDVIEPMDALRDLMDSNLRIDINQSEKNESAKGRILLYPPEYWGRIDQYCIADIDMEKEVKLVPNEINQPMYNLLLPIIFDTLSDMTDITLRKIFTHETEKEKNNERRKLYEQ